MAEKLQTLLKEVGSKLENPPANKDALIKLLKQAAACLCEVDQSPPKQVLESMQALINGIVKPELLKHHDKEVKLLVATCTCEITRVTAPDAPYDDHVLKDIFGLIVSSFSGLRETKSPSFGRRVAILETVAKYRSCIVMLDLGCHDLINEMFRSFFAVASDDHSETVITSMKTIMVLLLEESEEINENLLLIILSVLGQDKKAVTMGARRLAMNVIAQCAGKLEAGIKQMILKLMSGEGNSVIDYHEIIYNIYRAAPQALVGIVPYITGELLTDKIEFRLKVVKVVGELFCIPGSTIPDTFQPIFLEFLRRLSDRVVEVRMSVLEHVKLCMLSNPFRPESPQLIGALCDRLLDYDESIREKVVAVVSDIACHHLSSIPPKSIKLLADRLRDKSLPVKKYTMERLSEIYTTYCLNKLAGLTVSDDYDWIPGRILRCFFDKDLRSDKVEYILCTSLFPAEYSVKDKVKAWVKLLSKFDKVEVKALEKILEQKQRLQLELQKYLSLRRMYKDGDEKKVGVMFRLMAHCFTDPTKAESDFMLLHELKDANVWKILRMLIHPNTNSLETLKSRDELLKIIGRQHPLYGILSTLSIKCSYILFNKDYIKDIFLEVDLHKASGNKLLLQSCMNLLVILASLRPSLVSGTEKDLIRLLEEDDNQVIIKEGVLHVVAKSGGAIRDQSSSSTLNIILERICVQGSRRQAKYAVHALAAITKDDALKSLSLLYKRLVDMLEKKTHLPSVLQSLGCIAQIAMPVYETQESKVESLIKKDILGCSEKPNHKPNESWNDRSQLCSWKIYGIKALVKSYLHGKDGELIKDLKNILTIGEISQDIESSCVDKAHLKLAAAKAIVRVSKQWDKKIPIDVFYLTLTISQVGFPEVRKLFLNKVHQYIKDRSLDPKYACAFFLGLGSLSHQQDNGKLSDIIQMCQIRSNVNSARYILPYLIHALAHHPCFPNLDECKHVKSYEPFYRKLYLFLSKLALGDEQGKTGKSLLKEEVISVLSLLQSIRRSKDAVDTNMSKNSYAICDLCFSITKRLAQNEEDLQGPFVHVAVPEMLYEKKEEKEKEDVTEGQTWLADATALAHFQSLNMDTAVMEDDIVEEEDGKEEVSLGTMLKLLKAKGVKERKAAESNNNVDMLGSVKEINLDDSDPSTKFNGNEETKQKRKRRGDESTNVSVSKRDKSSSTAFDDIKMSDEEAHTLKLSSQEHIEREQHGNTEQKPKKHDDNQKKRKRISVKTKSKEGSHTTDLVGKRIQVWWPMDQAFYQGLVKSYDHQKKKHVVLYNDGEVEVLRLNKERWKLMAITPKVNKSPHRKRGSNKKIPDNSKKFKDLADISPSSSMARGKRSQTKDHDTEEEASDQEGGHSGDEEKQSPTSSLRRDNSDSDDVPLGVWRSKVRKPDASKQV